MQKIIHNLWYDDKAEEAANFYASLFNNSKVGDITRYGEAAAEISGQPKGSILTVEFQLEGQEFIALNGGQGPEGDRPLLGEAHRRRRGSPMRLAQG